MQLGRRPAGVDTLEPGPGALEDDLGHAAQSRRTIGRLTLLGIGLVATVVVAVGLGPVSISPLTVDRIIRHHLTGSSSPLTWTYSQDAIVWKVRAPRVLLGAVVGAGLAVSGVVLQAMVRNVLAEPYLLGISYGASTGAAAAIIVGIGSSLGGASLSVTAFFGALGASILVFTIARASGRVTSARLLLAGVSVAYVLYAATNVLIFVGGNLAQTRAVLFWMLGSVALARWEFLLAAAPVVLIAIPLLMLWSRKLDALAIGDDTALALGVRPERFRAMLLVVVSLMVGALVAVSGGIGFVGLIIPHIARRIVGSSHRKVIPVAALVGAIFLVWADVAGRLVLAPRELPLGVVTAVVGAPFLLVLVRKLHGAVQ
jgi:iron complex transport system permease protein